MATGELVFNTVAVSGYQEVITDPSYAGQVIAFTYPHIGNYGTNATDDEADAPYCRGVIVRDLAGEPSNWRVHRGPRSRSCAATASRRSPGRHAAADPARADGRRRALRVRHRTRGRAARRRGVGRGDRRHGPGDGGDGVTAAEASVYPATGPGAAEGLRIVAYDFGIKTTMVRQLDRAGPP